MFSWGEAGETTHNIYLSLTAIGATHDGQIIFGNQGEQVQTNPATEQIQPNTDYWILFQLSWVSPNPLVYIKVCTNKEGTNVVYELNSNFDFTTYGRDSFYLNGATLNIPLDTPLDMS